MKSSPESKIAFKFLRPAGISVTGYGRMNPSLKKTIAEDAESKKIVGNVWVEGYDFDEVIELKLASETPRKLPKYLDGYDDETKRVYLMEQMKVLQANHEQNNLVRDELAYYEGQGIIKVLFDSMEEETAPEIIESAATADSATAKAKVKSKE